MGGLRANARRVPSLTNLHASHAVPLEPLDLSIFGIGIRIRCPEARPHAVLSPIFATFAGSGPSEMPAALEYRVDAVADERYELHGPGNSTVAADGMAALVSLVERSIVVALQRANPSLLFLHAAVLERNGAVCLLVADSGSGKSTTTWALLHHGFRYLSDELAPVDLTTMQVLGYPHALCLKREPPAPYVLPPSTIPLGRTMHVPTAQLQLAPAWNLPHPLAAVLHIAYDPEARQSSITSITAAESAARLYVNALNALAHPACGLDAVSRIAAHAPNFSASTGDLTETCAMIAAVVDDSIDRQRKT